MACLVIPYHFLRAEGVLRHGSCRIPRVPSVRAGLVSLSVPRSLSSHARSIRSVHSADPDLDAIRPQVSIPPTVTCLSRLPVMSSRSPLSLRQWTKIISPPPSMSEGSLCTR